MDYRLPLKDTERKYLEEKEKENPSSFISPVIHEDNNFLSRFGIFIPHKENFPNGYIKLYHEDFIVEEILENNEICTIEFKPIQTEILPAKIYEATLVKNGLRTTEAVSILAKKLDCNENQIKYYGLKDEDAITSQKISLSNIDPIKLLSIKSENFFLKDIKPTSSPLIIGKNKGNRFSINVRLEKNEKKIETPKIGTYTFFNYFYIQRFLSPRFANFYWALLMLQGDYKEAVKNFICFRSSYEQPFFQDKRKEAEISFGEWSHIKNIFNTCPTYFEKEIQVLNHLEKNPEDMLGALNSIPDQIKLWMYSLSSWFFNHKISTLLKIKSLIPDTLPMFLSNDIKDFEVYKDFTPSLELYPDDLKRIREFPVMNPKRNLVPTSSKAIVQKIELNENYLKITFDLSTGSYATTFLSHFLNLVSGKIPDTFFKEKINKEYTFF